MTLLHAPYVLRLLYINSRAVSPLLCDSHGRCLCVCVCVISPVCVREGCAVMLHARAQNYYCLHKASINERLFVLQSVQIIFGVLIGYA